MQFGTTVLGLSVAHLSPQPVPLARLPLSEHFSQSRAFTEYGGSFAAIGRFEVLSIRCRFAACSCRIPCAMQTPLLLLEVDLVALAAASAGEHRDEQLRPCRRLPRHCRGHASLHQATARAARLIGKLSARPLCITNSVWLSIVRRPTAWREACMSASIVAPNHPYLLWCPCNMLQHVIVSTVGAELSVL